MFGCRRRAMIETSRSSSSRTSAAAASSASRVVSDRGSSESWVPSEWWVSSSAAVARAFASSTAPSCAAAAVAPIANRPGYRPRCCFNRGSSPPVKLAGGPMSFTATSVCLFHTATYTLPKLPSPTHFFNRMSSYGMSAVFDESPSTRAEFSPLEGVLGADDDDGELHPAR